MDAQTRKVCELATELVALMRPWAVWPPEIRELCVHLTVALAAMPIDEENPS